MSQTLNPAELAIAVRKLRRAIEQTLEHVEDEKIYRATPGACTLCNEFRNNVLRTALEETNDFAT